MNDTDNAMIEKELLSLLAHNVFSISYLPTSSVDWTALVNESKKQAIFLLAFKDHNSYQLESGVSAVIEKDIKNYMALNMRNFQQNAILHSIMTKNNIPYCVIKGLSSAHYYPEPLLRPMGDVDFFVEPENVERAKQVLIENGFKVHDEWDNGSHAVLRKQDIHLEMHYDIAGIPYGELGDMIRAELKNVIADSSVAFDEFVEYNSPSAYHHGLIILLHMQHHLLAEGIGLRHLCDWAVFVNSFDAGAFEELFEQKLRTVGLWKFACVLTAACERIGLPHKSFASADITLANELLADILLGGNFGRKDKQRYYEGKFISNRGKDGVKKSRIRRLFLALNENVRLHWKFINKVPFLYPVGWCYVSLRYIVLAIRGKRHSINVIDTYKKSGNRKQLYAKLKLFEPK